MWNCEKIIDLINTTIFLQFLIIRGKNAFAKVSKNLPRSLRRSENHFVGLQSNYV